MLTLILGCWVLLLGALGHLVFYPWVSTKAFPILMLVIFPSAIILTILGQTISVAVVLIACFFLLLCVFYYGAEYMLILSNIGRKLGENAFAHRALETGMRRLNNRPLSLRVIKELILDLILHEKLDVSVSSKISPETLERFLRRCFAETPGSYHCVITATPIGHFVHIQKKATTPHAAVFTVISFV
jgi:hypothetical protein